MESNATQKRRVGKVDKSMNKTSGESKGRQMRDCMDDSEHEAIVERAKYVGETPDFENMYKQCQESGSVDDWNNLAFQYYAYGFTLNAINCFEKADALVRQAVPAEVGS